MFDRSWREIGLAIVFFCGAAVPVLQAQPMTTVASFNGTNGEFPSAIFQGADGSFYGTASAGNYPSSIFKMTATGTITALYTFSPPSTIPTLMQAKDGNFYGTTNADGINHLGTIFKLTPSGTFTILYQFTPSDGGNPYAAMVQGTDGNFYGTTTQGGPGNGINVGQGTIFQFTPAGTLTVLYGFSGPDGATPRGTLLQAKDGNFYGVTQFGGTGPCNGFNLTPNGCGTIFKITPTGTLTTLHNFTGVADDGSPAYGLTVGADGNFYGVTVGAGSSTQNGIAFRITPAGTLTTLATFEINQPINEGPKSSLVQASDGNFYGADLNHLFKMTPTGTVTNVYGFCQLANCLDGVGPDAVTLGTDGNVYGTAKLGGGGPCMYSAFVPGGCGVVFKWTISQAAAGPTISLVANAEGGESRTIAENTWVEIKGSLLSKTQRMWGQAGDFANNQMPTQLDAVSVTMNGIACYIYFISSGQINVLTPLNLGTGAVNVVVTSSGVQSNTFVAQAAKESIALFVFDGTHIVAQHFPSFTDVGPATLFPGLTTPAKSGETILVYANGFGTVTSTLTPGSIFQSGSLAAALPTMQVSGQQATVSAATLISPGLYQLNVILPSNLQNGDNAITLQYDGLSIPTGAVVAIQN